MKTPLRMIAALALALVSLPAGAAAQSAPLKLLSNNERVSFVDGGVTNTYFRVTSDKPLKLLTSGQMLLMIPFRPLPGAGGAFLPVDVMIRVDSSAGKQTYKATAAPGSARVTLSDGALAGAPSVVKIPVEAATAQVTVEARPGSAGVVVGFARTSLPSSPITTASPVASTAATPAPTPVAVAAAPTFTPAPVATAKPVPSEAIPVPLGLPGVTPGGPSLPGGGLLGGGPLIRKKVEKLSLGVAAMAFLPAGPGEPSPSANQNVYLGGELRFSPRTFDRNVSFCASAGVYQVRRVTTASQPFGPAGAYVDTSVDATTRVTPMLGSIMYKAKLGDRRALFLAAGGGIALTSRSIQDSFNGTVVTSGSSPAAIGRAGVETKFASGRLVLEGDFLHVQQAKKTDDYLGGGLVGLQYRFQF